MIILILMIDYLSLQFQGLIENLSAFETSKTFNIVASIVTCCNIFYLLKEESVTILLLWQQSCDLCHKVVFNLSTGCSDPNLHTTPVVVLRPTSSYFNHYFCAISGFLNLSGEPSLMQHFIAICQNKI